MFPNRSKASDGSIGDARHQASKSSDHNPYIKLGNLGIVSARDFTHDPENGIDCEKLANALVASRDPRIKYIIWNRRIISSKQQPWVWRPYSGKNAHSHHLHLSVMADAKLFDDESDWVLNFQASTNPPTKTKLPKLIKKGDQGEAVKTVQSALANKGFLTTSQIDGDFGKMTENAVRSFQATHGLRADGLVGENTKKALGI